MLRFQAKKGQVSLEFIIMVSLTLLIFAGFYSALLHKQMNAIKYNTDLEAKMLAEYIGYEVNLALTHGENFTKEFELPYKISVYEYNVSYETSDNFTLIYVYYDNRYSIGYTIANLSGSLNPGSNILRNTRGMIYAN